MELFDYMKELFTAKQQRWNSNVKRIDKSKHHFMMTRFLGIKFPVQANELNKIQIDTETVADYWNRLLSRTHTAIPSWMYIKTKKEKTKEKSKEWQPTDRALNKWFEMYDYSMREYKQYLDFYPLELKKELDEIERILKSNQ